MITRFERRDGVITYRMDDNRLHRADGPAKMWADGDYVWYINGQRHRYYGPQNQYQSWWIHDERIKNTFWVMERDNDT
jgi:hypothetical protein